MDPSEEHFASTQSHAINLSRTLALAGASASVAWRVVCVQVWSIGGATVFVHRMDCSKERMERIKAGVKGVLALPFVLARGYLFLV